MKKKLIIVLTFLFALLLVGCQEKPNEDEPKEFSWTGKEAIVVNFLRDKAPEEIDVDEFQMSMLTVEVEFSDGTKKEFTCDDSHFSLSKEIKSVGKPRLTIICKDDAGNEVETANFTLNIVSYTAQDTKAVEDATNIIVAKRNNDKIEFVVAKTEGLASGQLQYTYDTSKLTLGEVTKGASVGYVNAKVENGKIQIGFANDANLEAGTVICSIAYTGDYRNSGLAIDETFANGCWSIVDVTPTAIDNMVYHVSRK